VALAFSLAISRLVQDGGNFQTILKAAKRFFEKIGFLNGLKISALQH
jgi:hypothetical protein